MKRWGVFLGSEAAIFGGRGGCGVHGEEGREDGEHGCGRGGVEGRWGVLPEGVGGIWR